jgi:deoxyribose-phosphate aldolase
LKTKSNIPNSTIASYIDHTLLRPDADERMIRQLCAEALEYQFAAVCVPPCYVKIASSILGESAVKIATVVGFPFGYQTAEVKFFEAHKALSTGASEIDVVWNLAAFKTGKLADVENEIGELATLCHLRGGLLKVIIETALLSEEEIIDACSICAQAEADFVKTSTGFAQQGATVEDVLLIRQNLPERVRIKASGGIRDIAFAKELIKAGADRLGTSAGVQLLKHEKNQI